MKKFFKKVFAFAFHPVTVLCASILGFLLLVLAIEFLELSEPSAREGLFCGWGFLFSWFSWMYCCSLDELAEMCKKKSTPDEK